MTQARDCTRALRVQDGGLTDTHKHMYTHGHRSHTFTGPHTQHMQSHQCAPDTAHTYTRVHEAYLKHTGMHIHTNTYAQTCRLMDGLIHMHAHTHTHAHTRTHTPESLSAPHRGSCHSSEKAKEMGPSGCHVLGGSLTWPC